MSILTGEMGWRDNQLCVIYKTRRFNEPVEEFIWWPICGMNQREAETNYVGRYCESTTFSNGQWRIKHGDPDHAASTWWETLYLREGSQTKSIHVETHPIPCPKVRKAIETRYWQGRWQKYLKSEGWVIA